MRPERRAILCHWLFRSTEAGFISEAAEVQRALHTVSEALTDLRARLRVSWVLDRGFDDVAVWHTIWEQQERLVYRLAGHR